ncbi:MAG: phosphopantetheine-binding protein [Defluviitaleaceae bacterium]|nr:phosphopantetheine-binding protein [Defluviitaleaceae bacterium]
MEREKVIEIVSKKFINKENITENTLFDDLGADSLDIFEILSEVENMYNIEIKDFSEYEIIKIKTVGDIVKYIIESI